MIWKEVVTMAPGMDPLALRKNNICIIFPVCSGKGSLSYSVL